MLSKDVCHFYFSSQKDIILQNISYKNFNCPEFISELTFKTKLIFYEAVVY